MFELPEAKRVCRGDLQSPASSRSPSPGLPDTYAIDALRNVFSLDIFTAPEDTQDENLEHKNDDESAEQEFEFRLFRAPAPKDSTNASSTNLSQSHGNTGVQKLKVRLRSPTPVPSGNGGFVVPFRGWDYYLSDPEAVMRVLNGKAQDKDGVQVVGSGKSRLRKEFLDAAVSGETVFAWAKTSWPGCQLPWRVIHLRSSSTLKTSSSSKQPKPPVTVLTTTNPPENKRKSKPGKKRRIILRKRLESKKADEEAEREKRNKRNREKKMKRRQRERDKKATLKETGGNPGNGTNSCEERVAESGMSPPTRE